MNIYSFIKHLKTNKVNQLHKIQEIQTRFFKLSSGLRDKMSWNDAQVKARFRLMNQILSQELHL